MTQPIAQTLYQREGDGRLFMDQDFTTALQIVPPRSAESGECPFAQRDAVAAKKQVRVNSGSAMFHLTTTTKALEHNALVISTSQVERIIFPIPSEGSIN